MFSDRTLTTFLTVAALSWGVPGSADEGTARDSPYFRAHAGDLVNWLPWGPEAFEKAQQEKKPIFVNVGYDSCHWCARMQAESFTNPAIAALLNRHFVNVLVDRVERPDLNAFYMAYLGANQGAGGWPINAWLTPEGTPFSIGTYFPNKLAANPEGRTSLEQVVDHIVTQWTRFPDYIASQSKIDFATLREQIDAADEPAEDSAEPPTTRSLATSGYEALSASFDPVSGGFSHPSKFPQGTALQFLANLSRAETKGSFRHRQILKLLTVTADSLVRGGVFDHVGGGFHRYALDPSWQLPRFEKMLPVQSEVVFALLDLDAVAPDPCYTETIRRTLDFVSRELRLPSGLFQASLGSDSKTATSSPTLTEGAYYTWTYDAFADAVGTDDLPVLADVFAIRPGGNLDLGTSENPDLAKVNVPRLSHNKPALAARLKLTVSELDATLARGLGKLAKARARRPSPSIDTSAVTGWNASMASAFARSFIAFGEPADLETARACVKALLDARFEEASGRLTHLEGAQSGIFAYSYAATIRALLDLYDATLDPAHVRTASLLQERQLEFFWDEAKGGFFEILADSPGILIRPKNFGSEPEANTNDISASNLVRLADLLAEPKLLERCSALQRFALPRLTSHPGFAPGLLSNALLLDREPRQILLDAGTDAGFSAEILRIARSRPHTRVTVFAARPTGSDADFLSGRLPGIREAIPGDGGKPSVRIGRGFQFAPPLHSLEELDRALAEP